MYQIEARIVYESNPWGGWFSRKKPLKHEWFRWGGTYKTVRRVLQSIDDMNKYEKRCSGKVKFGKKGKWIKTWWEFRPIHFYKS